MNRIEEVVNILEKIRQDVRDCTDRRMTFGEASSDKLWVTTSELYGYARQICQLFPQPLDDKKLREKIAEAYWLEYRNVCWSAFWDTSWADLKLKKGSPANTYATACYRFADQILVLLQPKIEEARRQGENRIIKWVEDTDILIMLSPKKREDWQALKGGGQE